LQKNWRTIWKNYVTSNQNSLKNFKEIADNFQIIHAMPLLL